MTYDSTQDTVDHIWRVQHLVEEIALNLGKRRQVHDKSKLVEPEKSGFDTCVPKLKELTYGSDEYRAALKELKSTLNHHYFHNDHHPEHYAFYLDGEVCDEEVAEGIAISRMSLMSLAEMLADWKAAGERMNNGSLFASLEYNQKRFGMSDQLYAILCNTAIELGWA